jgi:NAD(P)-dependent dehydrogenase (short-subunit alcohol dehydrogenase family)
MLLENKVVVIYGAAGAIGSACARAFAREGARLFLTGRRQAPVDALAHEISPTEGSAEAAEVDALDEAAVERHLGAVVKKAGRVDVSFNAVGLGHATPLGIPLAAMDVEQFCRPITEYAKTWFVTARAATRFMVPARAGVIMTLSALPARRGTPLNGGYGAAQAAKEQLVRDLSVEFAPKGIRVIGLRPHGLPETPTMRKVFDAKGAASSGMTWEQFTGFLASMSHTRRVMTLPEVANMAAFLASDQASGMTGTTVNLTMGGLDD